MSSAPDVEASQRTQENLLPPALLTPFLIAVRFSEKPHDVKIKNKCHGFQEIFVGN